MKKNDIVKVKLPTSLSKKHANKWVALSSDYRKIIATGNNLPDILKKTSNTKKRVVLKVLPRLGYVPLSDF